MKKRISIPFAKVSDRCMGRGGACDRLEKSWMKQNELYAQGRSSLDVSIDVRDEVLIDVGWKISVDGRVVSVDGGERVSVNEIGVWVDGGWRVSIDELVLLSIDELVLLSIDEELLPLRIKRSKLAGSDENSSGVSLLLLVLHGMHLKRQEKKFMSERGLKK
ncbi:hypothetical protein DY000_02030821 [Brassica cretica]|uniref:Uncharacterized protein n=1 Tax=Brassica cretica TaxID=69181 RepID=A0ABQ7DJA2_BRACR|nr:hypothetical protein DY000_02030821 [Brassica cretica]